MARRYQINPGLAASLRQRRIRAGLSQNALALATGCLTEASVARYETLRCGISAEAQAAIEHALVEAGRQPVAST